MDIRIATDDDLEDVLTVERTAFGYEKEAQLTRELLADESAKPLISLLASDQGRPLGHILFTRAQLQGMDDPPSCLILAPLAVVPEQQKKGLGGELIREGLRLISETTTGLVFVLGHPEYYPRHGFQPAGRLGIDAPYPIPEEVAGAWMVQAMRPGLLDRCHGTVVCADALDRPEHWRE